MLSVFCRSCCKVGHQTYKRGSVSFHTSKMDPTLPFEEENLPWYSPDQFYPVTIGEVLDSSYRVLGKLGYGAHSTVWLCRHIRDRRFVVVKVCTRDGHQSARVSRELRFYEHVSSLKADHHGQSFIRGLLGTFEITGPTGQHLCLVHPPMHMTVRDLQYMKPSRRLNEPLLRWTLSNVLSALTFLHEQAEVIHTDINPSNIMLTVADDSVLESVEKAEAENMLPKKVVDNVRTIYCSHKLVLCDFGEARIGKCHKGLIQLELYRAPEVLFNMEWGSSVDIWSVAALVWDLFENRHLFHAVDENGQPSATNHVAEMVAYLGLSPSEYIRRSETTDKVFNKDGNRIGHWKGAGGVVIPPLSLDRAVTALDGESKRLFLDFIKPMLDWLPEKRKRASELLKNPWLNIATS
ncbi:non-specific serine/threonine protein kinase [Bimuria novae-zelandiae CBS 107.79]|uniref:non-specific serine/threonine protein kinase n=1 Tax=Bimuria novae-zelandiae CBS 107.79 TaxID=1447943 RepID=A0A6A5VX53_9PLEO|nr:non-specific serine/threonine protein kinase [Bimuria novae-zelandiae CBS 107.79]